MAIIRCELGREDAQPEMQEKGVIAARFRLSLSDTASAGDVIIFGKLPVGAVILDAYAHSGAADSGIPTKLGLSASAEAFFTSQSFSAGISRMLKAPPAVVVADDEVNRFEHVTASTLTQLSVGHYLTLVVFYRMPGQTY